MSKQMTAILVDDEYKARENLKTILNKNFPEIEVLDTLEGSQLAVDIIKRKKPQILFLDISMPLLNGFDLLNQLEERTFALIFVTAHADQAIKAIRFSALDYILKPINITELNQAVANAKSLISLLSAKKTNINGYQAAAKYLLTNLENSDENDSFCLNLEDGFKMLKFNEIVKIRGDINYSHFELKNGDTVVSSKSLLYFEELLPEKYFIRVHKSYMINKNYVSRFESSTSQITLKHGEAVPVARRRIKTTKAALANL